MAGWVPVPTDLWLAAREHIPGRWPEALVVLDLRYWADPIACNRKPRPSLRALATTWEWSKSAVAKIIANPDRWVDTGRTAGGHRVDSEGTVDAGETPTTPKEKDSRWTAGGHRVDTGWTPPKETHAQSPLTPHPSPDTPSPSVKKDSVRPLFDSLAEYWCQEGDSARLNAWHAAGAEDRKPPKMRPPKWPHKSEAANYLRKLIADADSTDDIRLLFRWHWHGPDRRGNRGAGRGIATLQRKLTDYLQLAQDWDAGIAPTSAPSRPSPSSGTGQPDFAAALREFENEEPEYTDPEPNPEPVWLIGGPR